jgi:hypothetical protein
MDIDYTEKMKRVLHEKDIILINEMCSELIRRGHSLKNLTYVPELTDLTDEDIELIIETYNNLNIWTNKLYAINCINKKHSDKAAEFLLDVYKTAVNYHIRSSADFHIHDVDNRKYYREYIELVLDEKYTFYKEGMIKLLGKIRKDDVKDTLLKLTDDYYVGKYAIKALKNFNYTDVYIKLNEILSDKYESIYYKKTENFVLKTFDDSKFDINSERKEIVKNATKAIEMIKRKGIIER